MVRFHTKNETYGGWGVGAVEFWMAKGHMYSVSGNDLITFLKYILRR